jgi:hypothetical protein
MQNLKVIMNDVLLYSVSLREFKGKEACNLNDGQNI